MNRGMAKIGANKYLNGTESNDQIHIAQCAPAQDSNETYSKEIK